MPDTPLLSYLLGMVLSAAAFWVLFGSHTQSEDGRALILDVDIGKYIDISLVDVDVQV